MSGFSLTVAFVCLASALLVVFNLSAVQKRWSRAGRASVYLRDGTTSEMVDELKFALVQTPGIVNVKFISQEEARREIVGTTIGATRGTGSITDVDSSKDSAFAMLPAEAFPASIELRTANDISNVDIGVIAARLRQIPAVESVETYEQYTKQIQELTRAAMLASVAMTLVVLAAVVSVITSTIRLALQRRKPEVEILRLVGATERYVREPFIIEGSVLGAAGATAAVALLGIMYAMVIKQVDSVFTVMLGVEVTFLPWYAVIGLIASGAVIGAASSHISLRRMTYE